MVLKLKARRKLGGNVKSDVATGAKLRDKKPPVSEVSGRILRKRVEIKEKVPKKRKLEDLEDEPSVKVNFEDFKDKKRVFVTGFNNKIKDADIMNLFSNFKEFNMPHTRAGGRLNMGIAYVTFETEDEAKKAIENTNGKELNGKKLIVEYSFHRTTEKKVVDQKSDKTTILNLKIDEVAKPPPNKRQKPNLKSITKKSKIPKRVRKTRKSRRPKSSDM